MFETHTFIPREYSPTDLIPPDAPEPDVDRDEIVGAVHFGPMAGIKHNSPVGPGDQIAEI